MGNHTGPPGTIQAQNQAFPKRDIICFTDDPKTLKLNPPCLRTPLSTMRISINHNTIRKGWLFKTTYYEVELTVAFSHEEKQIMQQRGLLKTKLVDRRPATAKVDDRDEKFELRVEHLIHGRTDSFLCATPSKAKIYEEELLSMLQQMKLWLEDNAEVADGKVIEL